MAPPATPSPHRFLPSNRRQISPTKSAGAPSKLIQSTTTNEESIAIPTPQWQFQRQPPTQPIAAHPPASQFAPTPRFAANKPKPATQHYPTTISPPRPSLAHALRPSRQREDVEETHATDLDPDTYPAYHHHEESEMLLDTELGEIDESVHQSIEHNHSNLQSHDPTTTLPFSPKRRRLDPTSLSTPHPAPRFAPPTTSTSTPAPAAAAPRPSFLRPPTPPLPAPIPQTFSPHRRGASFLPGEMASTVQAWVVAAGQSAAANKRVSQYHPPGKSSRDEGWGFRVRVERAEGVEGAGGGWRVLGRREGDGFDDGGGEGRVRCLLVGEGKGEVRVGGAVGVGGLGWRVDVDVGDGGGAGGGEWLVGVGWEAM